MPNIYEINLMETGERSYTSSKTIFPNEIHLWLVQLDDNILPSLFDLYVALLSKEEFIRYHGFFCSKQGHNFLICRALIRTVLGQYLGISPQNVKLSLGENGKPNLSFNEHDLNHLEFNLSHTKKVAILALTFGQEIGIDIEFEEENVSKAIVYRYFSREEVTYIDSAPSCLQAYRFWEIWTLKEAYLKSIGLGLSAPLNAFSFNLNKPNIIKANSIPDWKDDFKKRWFAQWKPSSEHIASICMDRGNFAEPPNIHVYHIVPLYSIIEQREPLILLRHST